MSELTKKGREWLNCYPDGYAPTKTQKSIISDLCFNLERYEGYIESLTAQIAEARDSLAKQVEAKEKACAALMNQLAEWHKVFGHLSKDADTAGNMINEGIAERDKEIADCNKFNFELQQANAALRTEIAVLKQVSAELCPDCGWAMKFPDDPCCKCELERLKEESSHLWVRIESGEAAAYEQGKAEARKQVAREVEKHLLGMHWTIPYHETEAMIDRDEAIFWVRHHYGLEG